MTKPTLTDLRIASAKALGKDVDVDSDGVVFTWVTSRVYTRDWAPDLKGHEAQLVELIEFLRSKDSWFPWHTIIRPANDDWKLAIMRAVAEVSDDT